MLQRRQRNWCFCVLAGVLVSIFLYSAHHSLQVQQGPPPPLWTTLLPHRQSVNLSDGTITFHLNLSCHEAEFPHLQHPSCHPVIAEAGLCQRAQGAPLFLVGVKSHPASSSRRAALRRTWARPGEVGGYWLQPLFLVAMASNIRYLNLVQEESSSFGDVVLWDFAESHHNLSLKEHCFLQWLHSHCQQVTFVFKGDDDLFMNPRALVGYLQQRPDAARFIHGNIQCHSPVMRFGKYDISTTLYPQNRYPCFASGGGFIVPGSMIPALYQTSLRLPVFPLDDVYFGFLVLAARLSFNHDQRFRVWGVSRDTLEVYRESFVIHRVSLERMEEVWTGLWGSHQGKEG
uniref:N-acetyllactosaminide beta-1,3-N-acetylglucosaminyltransferase 3-like n=1 Tax=Euleptes europaea TaxID=460621 RepID=UPI00254182B1|nr:N-acetyllactosaminide beta-1,3-N-acetylglucosaminyltransferase 3-like [Euleptes europaea]